MVSVSSFQKGVAATSLTPFLSELSTGTEMASYGNPQWEFLLAGGDINAYVVPSENDDTNLLGSLLRVELSPAASTSKDNNGAATTAADAAGFGMMLVSREARGKGVAKLLNKAIDDDGKQKSESPIRKLLPACSAMGQPVYSKLGFSSVGKVTGLSTEISKARNIRLVEEGTTKCVNVKTFGSMDKDATMIDSKIRNMLIEMDSKATGYDRTNRLSFMLRNNVKDVDGVKTIVAIATRTIPTAADDDDNDDKEIIGAAVIRREMRGGPFVVGPIIGSYKAALPLVKALAKAVPNDAGESKITVMVSDHHELVDDFTSSSFEKGFEYPAMSLDGKPIYEKGDGSYLGIIHLTLG